MRNRHRLKSIYACVLLALASPAVSANPLDPAVVTGQASFAATGNTLTVTNTPGTIINWQGFSIGANEITRFAQQSASSAVLNRVISSNPSSILGALQSNGRVFLINPNGIVFGAGAVVDVAGLVASTLNFSDADFLAGRNNFTQVPGAANISNAGDISAQDGGQIFLIAPNVENTGVITAPNGEILLAAGHSVDLVDTTNPNLRVNITAPAGDATNVGQLIASAGSLGLFGTVVRNSGAVSADSATMQGGKIVFKASLRAEIGGTVSANGTSGGSVDISAAHSLDPNAPGVVMHTGSVQAQGITGAGGAVSMNADNILSASSINVSGTTSGGQVSVLAAADMVSTSGAVYTANGGTASGGDILVAAGGNIYTSGSNLAQGVIGGNITLTGKDVTLSAALLDASGQSGGGVIHVGGMLHGAPGFSAQGVALTNAGNLTVTGTSQIIANALQNGNGGEIVLWSDGMTLSGGALSAQGGALGGNGGFVEVSGKRGLGYAGQLDLTAPYGTAGSLLLDPTDIIIDSAAALGGLATGVSGAVLADPHPVIGNNFGSYTYVLTNGNIVIAVPADSLVAASAGAVYLFSGTTGALISTLAGSSASDRLGIGGVTALTNGNFVVDSYVWSGGAGAVTWGSGTTGVSGAVSSANSLVGNSAFSSVGYFGSLGGWDARNNITNNLLGHSNGVVALTNGNYVVVSPYWGGSNQGAVTWGNGTAGVTGFVNSATNSLVGSAAADFVGFSVTTLNNGNYVVGSPNWHSGVLNYVGAATWGNGTTGSFGVVSAANSIVGSLANDTVGASITALSNGNYVVNSYGWSSKSGAVTWGNGAGGTVGAVSAANSLVGTLAQNIGWGSGLNSTDGVVVLTGNGNYVVNSSSAGFATWGNGLGGTVGNLSVVNSLQGTGGSYATKVTQLTNGNYVVANSFGNPGAVTGGGTVTWGDGTVGTVGTVSSLNSLFGSTVNDNVGSGGITALSNGNYVVTSQNWDNATIVNAGAVSWGNGAGGTVGAVSSANSLVGSTANDQVGLGWSGATVAALSNGNYVVGSKSWDNAGVVDAGAATWGDGSTGGTRLVGSITASNSLVGLNASDYVGVIITALKVNGNYVVSSNWANGPILGAGAATWGNGLGGTVGAVSAVNSLVGSTLNDGVGGSVVALPGGNYVVVSSAWDSGAIANVGAVTWGNGLGGTAGTIAATGSAGIVASLIGDQANDGIGGWFGGSLSFTILSNGNYVVNDPGWHGNTGYVGIGSATTGLSGIASAANGAVGAIAGDYLGYDYAGANTAGGTGNGVRALANGGYVISSKAYGGGLTSAVGRVSIEGIVFNGVPFSSTPTVPLSINPSDIIAQLNAGTSVILQANNDITQNALASIISAGSGNLTLQAGRSVILKDVINIAGVLNITANDPGAVLAYRTGGAAVIDTSLATLTASRINLANSGGDILAGAMTASAGMINLAATGILAINSSITAAGIFGKATGVTLGAAGTLNASGTGSAIVLDAGIGNFINNAGATALTNTGGGRWLVYSTDPALDTLGGLVSGNLALWGKTGVNYAPASVVEAGNRYLFSLTPTLAVSAGAITKTYGTDLTVAPPAAIITGLINAAAYGNVFTQDVATGTASLASTGFAANAGVAASPYAISVAAGTLVASNYTISYVNGALTITPAPLTITANVVTKTYGTATVFAGTEFTSTGLQNTEAIGSVTLSSTGAAATAGVAGSPYAITASAATGGTFTAGNYTISYVNGALTITPLGVTIAANAATKLYGDADTLTFTVSTLMPWDTNVTAFTGALGRAAGENVGTYAINSGTLASTNYAFTGVTPSTLTITQALLTVAANATSKILNTTDPLLTYTVTGLKFTDTTATTLTGSLSRIAGETVGTYQINQGSLSLSLTGSGNYTMSYVPANFTILVPTVIDEIVNTGLMFGPDTGSSRSTSSKDEEDKAKEEILAVEDIKSDGTATQPLPVCN